jgi:hypothetical protein
MIKMRKQAMAMITRNTWPTEDQVTDVLGHRHDQDKSWTLSRPAYR